MKMTKRKKLSFAELVKENKLQLLRDQAVMEKIEEKLEKRHLNQVK
jgi:hypothetical protein